MFISNNELPEFLQFMSIYLILKADIPKEGLSYCSKYFVILLIKDWLIFKVASLLLSITKDLFFLVFVICG